MNYNITYQNQFTLKYTFSHSVIRSPLSLRYSSSANESSVIIPWKPAETALSNAYLVLQTQPRLKIPLLFRCQIKGLVRQFIIFTIFMNKFTLHLSLSGVRSRFHSSNYLEYTGICKKDSSNFIKGTNPKKYAIAIEWTTLSFMKLCISGHFLFIQKFFSFLAPIIVLLSLLCSFKSLMNSVMAVSVGVFSYMFIIMLGNFLKTSQSFGIFSLLLLTLSLYPKSSTISSRKPGKSPQEYYQISRSTPQVLFK